MAIEDLGNGGFIVTPGKLNAPRADGSDGTDDIHRFRIKTMQMALYSETKGIQLKRGRSMTACVKSEFGLKGRAARVYREFSKMHNLPLIEERRRG